MECKVVDNTEKCTKMEKKKYNGDNERRKIMNETENTLINIYEKLQNHKAWMNIRTRQFEIMDVQIVGKVWTEKNWNKIAAKSGNLF